MTTKKAKSQSKKRPEADVVYDDDTDSRCGHYQVLKWLASYFTYWVDGKKFELLMYFLPSKKIRQGLQILILLNFSVKKHHSYIFEIKSTKHEDFKNIGHAPEKCSETCLLDAFLTKKFPLGINKCHIFTHFLQFRPCYFFSILFYGKKPNSYEKLII